MCPGFERTQYIPVLAATSGEAARKTDVLAPRRGLISKGRTRRMPHALTPARSPSMPKLLRTPPGWAAFAVTALPCSRRASSRVNSRLASLERQ